MAVPGAVSCLVRAIIANNREFALVHATRDADQFRGQRVEISLDRRGDKATGMRLTPALDRDDRGRGD
jgi:hypothetical protein